MPSPVTKSSLGGSDVHNSSHRFDLDVAWRASHLALQPIVGLLPERRLGPDCRDCFDFGFNRPSVRRRRSFSELNKMVGSFVIPTIFIYPEILSPAIIGMRKMTKLRPDCTNGPKSQSTSSFANPSKFLRIYLHDHIFVGSGHVDSSKFCL